MKNVVLAAMIAALAWVPVVPADAAPRPAACAGACDHATDSCCGNACACPVSCQAPAVSAAVIPPAAPLVFAPRREKPEPPRNEASPAREQRPPVPPPRA